MRPKIQRSLFGILTRTYATTVDKIRARQIFDSRGNPTVEVDLVTKDGLFRAAVPSGASTGVHEALELRDGSEKDYMGKSVFKAVCHVNKALGPEVIKSQIDVAHQQCIDELMIKMDGTQNKAKYGANAILGISMAICKAGAASRKVPLYRHIADLAGNSEFVLPVPSMNVINGGSHAGNKLAMQEFMILPTGARCYSESLKIGTEVYHNLKKVIKAKFGLDATAVGDEGGFAPNIQSNKEAVILLNDAIAKAGYTGRVEIGMDCAASEMFKKGKYDLDFKNPKSDPSKFLPPAELQKIYDGLVKEFPIVTIEDPFEQDDWDAWSKMTASSKIQIVGDDLLVTNPMRIAMAAEKKACNALLLKINQIGTITEAICAHLSAKCHGWGTMVSHRSGETEDTFIADMVVGLASGQIKTGAPCRSERCCKYNQILRIEEELGKSAVYAGKKFRMPLS